MADYEIIKYTNQWNISTIHLEFITILWGVNNLLGHIEALFAAKQTQWQVFYKSNISQSSPFFETPAILLW